MEQLPMKTLLVIAGIACAVVPASAQSWGRGGAYAGAGGTSQGYYPRTRAHSCTWSVTAACSAWRNGVYDDGKVLGTNWSSVSPTGDIWSGCIREEPG